MERTGKVIRARREALGMSQELLAWFSGVSRTTVRNIESDRVEEARTWSQVERVLGWGPGSLQEIRSGKTPHSLLADDALRLMVKALQRRLEVVDDATARSQEADLELRKAASEASVIRPEIDSDKKGSPQKDLSAAALTAEAQASKARERHVATHDERRVTEARAARLRHVCREILEALADGNFSLNENAESISNLISYIRTDLLPGEVNVIVQEMDKIFVTDKRDVPSWEGASAITAVAAMAGGKGRAIRPKGRGIAAAPDSVAPATVGSDEYDFLMVSIPIEKEIFASLRPETIASIVSLTIMEARRNVFSAVEEEHKREALPVASTSDPSPAPDDSGYDFTWENEIYQIKVMHDSGTSIEQIAAETGRTKRGVWEMLKMAATFFPGSPRNRNEGHGETKADQ